MKYYICSLALFMTTLVMAQKTELVANIDKSGNLIGHTQRDHLTQEPFNDWYAFVYDDYSVEADMVKELKPLLKKVTIKAFMGTWCGDSQEQVPVFYNILDATDFKYKNIDMIAVNRSKKTPDNLQKGFDILRVPTFIFYKKGEEIGRIVEYPQESLESDMLKILKGEPYKHSYEK